MPVRDPPTLGPYRLLRTLGRGSMGVVYLAVDGRTQGPLALKVLALGPDLPGPARAPLRERFLAEAEAARRLSHPDIVCVHEVGEHDGTAWLAMELLGGRDLGRYTHMSRLLPEPLVLELVERLARALAHAHALGVVHRGIKPGNVILDLAARRVKLTDFGLAGLAGLTGLTGLGRAGVVPGTPLYMAPEQLAGAPADARSDIYSLGVLLFQLLSGRLPHEHASLGELLRAVARETAPDLRRLRPQLSPALAALVARALHKQPRARHADAERLADELAALQARREGSAGTALGA